MTLPIRQKRHLKWQITVMTVIAGATQSCFTFTVVAKDAGTKSQTKIVDLTHELSKGLPDFQVNSDAFTYKKKFTVVENGYGCGEFCMPEHYGTHVDAPNHFIANGASIDKLDPQKLMVPAAVIDVRNEVSKNPDYVLTVEKIHEYEQGGRIPNGAAVLLLTGWGQKWSQPAEYRKTDESGLMHFPAYSKDAAVFLSDERKAVYLGIDCLSVDPGNSKDFPVHHETLKRGMHLIENIAELERLPARGSTLVVAPLKIKDGTGSPARIFAILQ